MDSTPINPAFEYHFILPHPVRVGEPFKIVLLSDFDTDTDTDVENEGDNVIVYRRAFTKDNQGYLGVPPVVGPTHCGGRRNWIFSGLVFLEGSADYTWDITFTLIVNGKTTDEIIVPVAVELAVEPANEAAVEAAESR